MNDFIEFITALINTELLIAFILAGIAIVLWAIIGIVYLVTPKEDDPMDMFMGGRNPPVDALQGGKEGKE